MAHQAASYAVNGDKLGDDNSWLDHSRDLLLMVNHFRDSMKAPFVGLGHSMGAAQLYVSPHHLHGLGPQSLSPSASSTWFAELSY